MVSAILPDLPDVELWWDFQSFYSRQIRTVLILFCLSRQYQAWGWSDEVLGGDVRHVGSQEPAGELKEVGKGFRSTWSEKKSQVLKRQLYKTSDTACPTGGKLWLLWFPRPSQEWLPWLKRLLFYIGLRQKNNIYYTSQVVWIQMIRICLILVLPRTEK